MFKLHLNILRYGEYITKYAEHNIWQRSGQSVILFATWNAHCSNIPVKNEHEGQ
jgi:hypothetical protein